MRSDERSLDRLFETTRALERGPSPHRDQLRQSVATRLAGSLIAGSLAAQAGSAGNSAAGGGAGAKLASLVSGIYAKLAIGTVVGALAVSGSLLWTGRSEHPEARAPQHSASSEVAANHRPLASAAPLASSAPPPPVAVPAATAASPSTPAPPPMLGANQPTGSSATGRGNPPTPLPSTQTLSSSAVPSKDSLAEELALVRGAQSQLNAQNPNQALVLLNRYFRTFPKGTLLPEAQSARIKALCLAGRTGEAQRESRRFARANPDSPLATRAGNGCAEP